MRVDEAEAARLEALSKKNRASKGRSAAPGKALDHLADAGKKVGPILAPVPGGRKYRNVPTVVDGIRFDSKAEAKYYSHLCALKVAGLVSYFLRQTPFHLPGGVIYRADFIVFYADGTVAVVDVKGVITKEFAIKKRLVEATYPIKIEVVK